VLRAVLKIGEYRQIVLDLTGGVREDAVACSVAEGAQRPLHAVTRTAQQHVRGDRRLKVEIRVADR
jgi:hypothetical protein